MHPVLKISRSLLLTALSALAAGVTGTALAQAGPASATGSGLRFNGFGTVGALQAEVSQPWGFLRDITQPQQERDISTGIDSRLGLQVNWALQRDWELVGQAVLRRQDPDAGVGRHIDWAFLAWRPDDAWTVRLGRTAPDIFLLSDHRNVGYTYPWARPSVEFYGWMPLPAIDGIDAMRAWRMGDSDWRLRVGTGRSSALLGSARDETTPDSATAVRVDLNKLQFATLTREADGLTLKATFVRARLTLTVDAYAPLLAGLQGLAGLGIPGVSAEAAGFIGDLDLRSVPVRYVAFGGRYEIGAWSLAAELSGVDGSARAANGKRGYVSVGWRKGDWMPYLMAGQARQSRAATTVPVAWGPTLAPLIGPAAAADAVQLGAIAALSINAARFEQRTLALGLRWDFHPQAALKLQWERVRIAPGGGGAWTRVRNFDGATARVLSSAIDFVF